MQFIMNILHTIVVYMVNGYKDFEKWLLRKFSGKVERHIRRIYRKAGVVINGTDPWDVKVNDKDFFVRVANNAALALGETYMDGVWDCDRIDEFCYRMFRNNLYLHYQKNPINQVVNYLSMRLFNLQTKQKAWEIADQHYDLGNDLFESFLDPTMNYSCGYWRTAKTLDQAQLDKMELIAKKLMLKPGMKVLDIGCGWGGLVKYLAENCGVECVGITVSKEGAQLASERCADLPIEIRVQDYRDVTEKFDRIVSVGMFEHVGHKNYRVFFESASRCLKEDGLFLLHTIGVSHKYVPLTEPWFHKYIFPNGILPYTTSIPEVLDELFILEDWHNFGHDYNLTLMAWFEKFNKNWHKIQPKYGDKFYRMWKYYLLMAAGGFRSRHYNVWQILLSKNGHLGGYPSVR